MKHIFFIHKGVVQNSHITSAAKGEGGLDTQTVADVGEWFGPY